MIDFCPDVLIAKFPKSLPRYLRDIYTTMITIGPPFIWQRCRRGHGIYITGKRNAFLTVSRRSEGWVSVFTDHFEMEEIAKAREKKEVFKSALDFARINRRVFIVCDADADWAHEPASIDQLTVIANAGYTDYLEELTKGQAATLIASGAFINPLGQNIFLKFL